MASTYQHLDPPMRLAVSVSLHASRSHRTRIMWRHASTPSTIPLLALQSVKESAESAACCGSLLAASSVLGISGQIKLIQIKIRYNWIQLLKPMYRRIISPNNLRDLWLLSPLKWHIQIQANSKDSRASSHHSKDVTSNDRKFSKQQNQNSQHHQVHQLISTKRASNTPIHHPYQPLGSKTSDILYRIRLARQHLEGPGHWSSR